MNTSHQPAVRQRPLTRTPARLGDVTDFDEFLYAPIGEERHGLLLSVLSALARRDVDPWDEAARLARLPRTAAIQFLTTLIAALPEGSSAGRNPRVHAERLAALLPPAAVDAVASHSAPVAGVTARHHDIVRYAFFYVLLMAFFIGAQWLMAHRSASPAAVSAPPAGAASLPTARPVR